MGACAYMYQGVLVHIRVQLAGVSSLFLALAPGSELRFMHLFCMRQCMCMIREVGSGTHGQQQSVWS